MYVHYVYEKLFKVKKRKITRSSRIGPSVLSHSLVVGLLIYNNNILHA